MRKTDSMENRILVTGGAGFIGSHIAESLAERGFEIRVYDNLSAGSSDNIEHLLNKPSFEFIAGDLLINKIFRSFARLNHKLVFPLPIPLADRS